MSFFACKACRGAGLWPHHSAYCPRCHGSGLDIPRVYAAYCLALLIGGALFCWGLYALT